MGLISEHLYFYFILKHSKIRKQKQKQTKTKMSTLKTLSFSRLHKDAVLPSKGTTMAAGYDIAACAPGVVEARSQLLVATGWACAIPEGHYGRVAPRSGLASKKGIDVGAGVIDQDYRGPIGVLLFNHSDTALAFKAGDRIAQLILEKNSNDYVCVEELGVLADPESNRTGGFGSTGNGTACPL